MTDEVRNALARIRIALGNVYVHGKDNLTNLLGSIETLDNLLQAETTVTPESED